MASSEATVSPSGFWWPERKKVFPLFSASQIFFTILSFSFKFKLIYLRLNRGDVFLDVFLSNLGEVEPFPGVPDSRES